MDKIAMVESSNRHTDSAGKLIESVAGALGKYQIKPDTAKQPGFGIEPIADLRKASEAEHRRFASDYYQAMLREFKGDEEKALAAYNSGHQTVKKAIEKYGVDWKKHIPKESKDYIQKIASL
jgi:soluble lytic murein transglycosylase-like protein